MSEAPLSKSYLIANAVIIYFKQNEKHKAKTKSENHWAFLRVFMLLIWLYSHLFKRYIRKDGKWRAYPSSGEIK